ncbi:PREDICTED: leucine-rich repeat, immunoglobulin-like domain and transmembrane domain-containing protein 2 [Branchiostoma belcheri]|uniref:Leucine-rich repeat, immunoglobulin-like domain and transmembrane domain-containing protein 2 n=1 Tax=Branchiostoma belcheri TaxID=7741 RepID=A0A6P4Z1V2_BRABE|nr:PREDICTED: leucine-rich repeat, immunoglobulin-like domain and transmembrane domain-containing protein 2 [Branchiostoma belcheri]
MPNLTLLDLSDNRLRTFPWSSLRNASNICELKLNNNEISKVDAYVDFPESLTYLYLQCNRITTIPETFLHGLKPQKERFYLRIWKNPFLCDCKIQWIARLLRCVWERRQEGCVNGSPGRDMRCIQTKCNFHPNGVPVILDWLQKNKLISVKQPTLGESLRCDSPQELKGALLRNISLPTCASANDSANSQQTSVSVPVTDNLGVQESEKALAETEPPTLVINSWEGTTVNTPELSLIWKRLISGILGGALALFVAAFIIRCISHCRKRRQTWLNNMASAPTLPTRTGNRLQMIVPVTTRPITP